jgi:hypothetical protein
VSKSFQDGNTSAPLRTTEVAFHPATPAAGATILPGTGRLANPDAVLTRSDLRELGWQRRGVDALFRACPTIVLPGYSRPMIRVSDYLKLIHEHTFNGRDRVR